jgi:Glycine rich protein
VPKHVALLYVDVAGGTAGGLSEAFYGAHIAGYLGVESKQTLRVDVGGNGSAAGAATFGGGGAAGSPAGASGTGALAYSGGGASDVRTSASMASRVIVAAGSGGDGGSGAPEGPACDRADEANDTVSAPALTDCVR